MALVTVKVDPETSNVPTEGANFFHFTQVRDEIEMLVGYISLLRIHNLAISHANLSDEVEVEEEVVPEISRRYLLSPNGLRVLRDRVNEIWEKMEKNRADGD